MSELSEDMFNAARLLSKITRAVHPDEDPLRALYNASELRRLAGVELSGGSTK